MMADGKGYSNLVTSSVLQHHSAARRKSRHEVAQFEKKGRDLLYRAAIDPRFCLGRGPRRWKAFTEEGAWQDS
jgi:hypothetical protein